MSYNCLFEGLSRVDEVVADSSWKCAHSLILIFQTVDVKDNLKAIGSALQPKIMLDKTHQNCIFAM